MSLVVAAEAAGEFPGGMIVAGKCLDGVGGNPTVLVFASNNPAGAPFVEASRYNTAPVAVSVGEGRHCSTAGDL